MSRIGEVRADGQRQNRVVEISPSGLSLAARLLSLCRKVSYPKFPLGIRLHLVLVKDGPQRAIKDRGR